MQVILPDNIYFLYLGVLSFCKPFSKHGVAVPPLVSVKKSSSRFFVDITEEQKQESPLKNLEVLKALICAKKKKSIYLAALRSIIRNVLLSLQIWEDNSRNLFPDFNL